MIYLFVFFFFFSLVYNLLCCTFSFSFLHLFLSLKTAAKNKTHNEKLSWETLGRERGEEKGKLVLARRFRSNAVFFSLDLFELFFERKKTEK